MIDGDFNLDGRTTIILLFKAIQKGYLNVFEPGPIDGDILYLLVFYLLDLDYIRKGLHYFYWMIFWKRLKWP